jgi:Uma2 family endonuclease
VIELRSKIDDLSTLCIKIQGYMANGVRLGWLINPQDRQVEVYRPGEPVELLSAPASLSGGPVLPGFVRELSRIFQFRFGIPSNWVLALDDLEC